MAAPPPNVTVNYQHQRIQCGKSNCRCNTADQTFWHGPYWYAYWQDPKTKKQRSKYIGKHFDPPTGPTRTPHSESRPPPGPDEWKHRGTTSRGDPQEAERQRREREEAERNRRERERQEREQRDREERERQRARNSRHGPTDEEDAACLKVTVNVTREQLKKAWQKKVLQHHPDKYPDPAAKKRQEEITKNINAAYDRMKARRGWKNL